MGDNFNPGDSDNNLLRKILAKLSGGITATVSSVSALLFARAVTGSTYAPAFVEGSDARLAVDKTSGGLLSHIRKLTVLDDAVVAAGDVAHDSVDSGNPLKLGAVALQTNSNLPTAVTLGDRVQLRANVYGGLHVMPQYKDNYVIYALAARTATPTPVAVTGAILAARGLIVQIYVSAVTASPSITVAVEAGDLFTGTVFYTILTSAPIVTTGLYVLRIHPSLTPVANVAASDIVPASVRVSVTHGDADSITYGVIITGTL